MSCRFNGEIKSACLLGVFARREALPVCCIRSVENLIRISLNQMGEGQLLCSVCVG